METWVGLMQSYKYLQGKQEGQGQKTTEEEVRGVRQTAARLALKEEGLGVKNTGNLGKLEKPVRQHSPPKFLDVLCPPSTWISGLWSPETEAVTFPVTNC